MEVKKTPKADLERGKGLAFLLGLVVALSFVYVALEWRSSATEAVTQEKLSAADIDDAPIVEDPQQKEEDPIPEPQKVVEIQLPEEFKVVADDKQVAKLSMVSSDEAKPLPPPAPVAPPAAPKAEDEDRTVFKIVEKMPEPQGGMNALQKWLARNVRYPDAAADNGIQGRVMVSFVVEKDGSPSDVKVVRSVDPSLDKEAIRLVSSMPKWSPGMQRGKPVRVTYTLPVVFQLGN